jgi:hypothetical protein
MKDVHPFLLRFKTKVVSPTHATLNDAYEYDESQNMVMVKENNVILPAIHSIIQPLGTKKADIEKGEDSKDTLMWK